MAPNFSILNNAIELVSLTTIQGVFWGIGLSLYFLCTQLFYQQYRKAPDERQKLLFSFACNTVMVLFAGLELGESTRAAQLDYIDDGSDLAEFASQSGPGSAINIMSNIPILVIPILNGLVQLWRIWVIWGMSPYKFIVAIILLFLLAATQAINIYISISPPKPPLTPEGFRLIFLLEIAQVTGSLAFNLLVTLTLVGRIIIVRRRHNRLMGTTSESAKQYTSIVAMLVESYALDSVWTTADVIAAAITLGGSPVIVSSIFNNAGDQVTVIGFLLVSYRVLLKKAWTPETGRQLSTIRWNHDDLEATMGSQATSPENAPTPATIIRPPVTTRGSDNDVVA